MIKKLLHALVTIELALLVTTVILYLATMHADDFSGLIVIFPVYAMFGVGIITLIVYIASIGIKQPIESQGSKAATRKLVTLAALSVPVLYIINNFSAGYGNGLTILSLLYLCAVGVFLVLNGKNFAIDIALYVLLIWLPIKVVLYTSKLNDTNIYTSSKVMAIILLTSTAFSFALKVFHRLSIKKIDLA